MTHDRLLRLSDRWFRLLLRAYPADFRDQMGTGVVDAYQDRARVSLSRRGAMGLAWLWLRALADALRNGLGERLRPAASWRRAGHWEPDLDLARVSLTSPPENRRMHIAALVDSIARDLRYAARTLRRHPGFSATIVATLGVGIAVNTTVFTIVNAAILRPMPFVDHDRVVRLGIVNTSTGGTAGLSYAEFHDWQGATGTFEQIGASIDRAISLSGDDLPAVSVAGAYVSWNTFPMLGAPPAIGRALTEVDDRAGAPPVVVLSDEIWRTRYGADPSVVGRTVRVAGVPSTVIGVMPAGFGFPDNERLWLPLAALPEAQRTSRSARFLDVYGRLRPDVTIEQATAELTGIAAALAERHPDTNRDVAPRVLSIGIAAALVAALTLLLGAVGSVLLIACANAANLLLARAADRARDVTLRLALGASRWRIVRQLLAESLVLAAAGGLCGFALAYVGVRLFSNLPPEAAPPYFVAFTMDRVVLAYLVLLSAGSALLCGLVPAWHAARTDLAAALNDAARTSAGSRMRRRWTGAFVVAQVTLALVLLTGAGLMMHNLLNLVRTDAGVDTSGLLQAGITLQPVADTPERQVLLLRQIEERLSSSPDVAAALASQPPLSALANLHQRRMRVEGRPDAPADALPVVSLVLVGQGYFAVTGVATPPGLAPPADALLDDDQVLVNERFAAMFFPDEPVVGRRILLMRPPNAPAAAAGDEPWLTIAGVVGNIRQRRMPDGQPDPVVYRPYTALAGDSTMALGGMAILARSASGPAAAAAFVGDQVQAVHPDLPLSGVGTVDENLLRVLWPQRVFGRMFAILGVIALLLATCGLYAVTSYAVSRRTREIGILIALGADARRIWWTVTGTTLRQLTIGLALGAAGSAAIAMVLPAFLAGSDGLNPLVLAGVAAVLVAAGLVASALPARRALRVDPMTTLRAE